MKKISLKNFSLLPCVAFLRTDSPLQKTSSLNIEQEREMEILKAKNDELERKCNMK